MAKVRARRVSPLQLEVEKYLADPSSQELSDQLNNEVRFTISETSIPYRALKHWEEMKLLRDQRGSDNEWRRFSFMDVIWLLLIRAFRVLGVSISTLKKVCTQLETRRFSDRARQKSIQAFEYYFHLVMRERRPVAILIFDDETVEILAGNDMETRFAKVSNRLFVHVSLNGLFQAFMEDFDVSPIYKSEKKLSPEEMEVLFLLRTGIYESVTVKQRSGKIEVVEMEQTLDTRKRIVDILKESDFQDISIKRTDGKIVSIKRKIRRKIS